MGDRDRSHPRRHRNALPFRHSRISSLPNGNRRRPRAGRVRCHKPVQLHPPVSDQSTSDRCIYDELAGSSYARPIDYRTLDRRSRILVSSGDDPTGNPQLTLGSDKIRHRTILLDRGELAHTSCHRVSMVPHGLWLLRNQHVKPAVPS